MLGETPDGAPAPSRLETAKSLAIEGLYPAKHTRISRGSASSIAESNSNAIALGWRECPRLEPRRRNRSAQLADDRMRGMWRAVRVSRRSFAVRLQSCLTECSPLERLAGSIGGWCAHGHAGGPHMETSICPSRWHLINEHVDARCRLAPFNQESHCRPVGLIRPSNKRSTSVATRRRLRGYGRADRFPEPGSRSEIGGNLL